ncbi:MAG: DUF4292 domain-containing protein [Smithellaceae bacterium]|nr:DUF4292 domain-containing protein [Smithellaceae bacterium]
MPVFTKQKAIDLLCTRNIFPGTFQAIAQAEVSTAEGRYPVKLAILIQRPTLLRVEEVPLIGPPNFMMSLVGDDLRVFFPPRGEFYIGKAAAAATLSSLPLDFPPRELLNILTGTVPACNEERNYKAFDESGDWRLEEMHLSGISRSFWIDPRNGRISKMLLTDDRGRYEATFSRYEKVGGFFFPRKVILSSVNDRVQVVISYKEIELLPTTKQEHFELVVPAGVTTRPLE